MTRRTDHRPLVRGYDLRGSGRRVRPILPLLAFVALGLMLLSKLNHSALTDLRERVASWMSPVLQAAIVPLEPIREFGRTLSAQIDLSTELERLKTENQRLGGLEWRARQLESRLADLESLAKVVAEQRIDFVTSRVIADSSGAFVRSVMINSGRNQNVRSGFPVINADGLVGRVVETGEDSARILLASDLNSRIPVVVGPDQIRAILAGDNGPQPILAYLPEGAKIETGDDVSTSGVGGMFPRGIRIGKVAGNSGQPRVAMRTDLDRLEYLSVLRYDDPSSRLSGQLSTSGLRSDGIGALAAPGEVRQR